jgi:hypothetical protein
MPLSDKNTGRPQLKPKLLRRFYEPVVLLNAIDNIRGHRTKPETNFDDIDSGIRKTRRAFADSIAYICAYDRGPDFVTAVGLEKLPQGINVWLAANNNIEQKVVAFLAEILQHLQEIGAHDWLPMRCSAAIAKHGMLSCKIVTFDARKLQQYRDIIKMKYVQPCLAIIGEYCDDSSKLL